MTAMPEPVNMRSYYEATAHSRPVSRPLEADVACDLCIIGGGITGISAALHAAAAGLKVVLLEARQVGWAATGRAGGWLIPTAVYDPAPIAKQFGAEKAKRYFGLAHDAQDYCLTLISEHGINCDLKRGGLLLAGSAAQMTSITEAFELYRTEFGLRDAELIGSDDVAAVFGTDRYRGALFDHYLALVHPLNYALGLARAADTAGAQIHQDTPVVGYAEAGGRVTVTTAAGPKVDTAKLLIATNAYLGKMEPRLAKRFIAIYGNLTVTEPLSPTMRDAIFRQDLAGFEASMEPAYFRLTADDRLLFSAHTVTSSRDGEKARRIIRDEMHKIFPQTEGIETEFVSGGWFGVTIGGDAPDIGMLSDNIHFAQAIPLAWGSLHGRLLAEHLTGKPAEDYALLRDLDNPVAFGGKTITRTLKLTTSLVSGLRAMRAR